VIRPGPRTARIPCLEAPPGLQYRATLRVADTIFAPGRHKKSPEDQIPYSREALRQDLARVRNAWEECQLQLQGLDLPTNDEPFAAIILATADRKKVDKRTRSKWSRALRHALEYKPVAEPLAAFVQRNGGINACAARFSRRSTDGSRRYHDQYPGL
jgi:hypothetical protein